MNFERFGENKINKNEVVKDEIKKDEVLGGVGSDTFSAEKYEKDNFGNGSSESVEGEFNTVETYNEDVARLRFYELLRELGTGDDYEKMSLLEKDEVLNEVLIKVNETTSGDRPVDNSLRHVAWFVGEEKGKIEKEIKMTTSYRANVSSEV